MYSFAQRSDTTVVDEPLYAFSLVELGTEHPGREETLRSQSSDGPSVVRDVILGEYPTPVVFFKQMARHLIGLDDHFLAETSNMLLIRDPRPVIASLAKNLETPTVLDVGIGVQVDIFHRLVELGQDPVIVDSRDLLDDPEGVLTILCDRLQIPFDPAMLSWEAGPRPEDGVWATHWYANVHESTGFMPYRERTIELPPALDAVVDESVPLYSYLWERRIGA